jgi:hypothetical protein
MAITKPTTTKTVATTPDLTDTAEAAGPTEAERVAQIEELTDPAVVADVKSPKYVKVTSPAGFESEVPEGIVDSLLDSGYRKGK